MGFLQLQPPAVEPVSLTEAKNYARITTAQDDALVAALIKACRREAEVFCHRKFITQRWRMYLDAFPGYIDQRFGGIIQTTPVAIGATSYMAGIRWALVPPWAAQGIDAVCFIDANGNSVTMNPGTDYQADVHSRPARITPPYGKFWPIARVQTEAVWVDWTCGYGGPITVSMAQNSAVVTGAKFYPSDVGKSITIPGGLGASPQVDLLTTIASVDVNGQATLANPATAAVTAATIWWGEPVPDTIWVAICMMLATAYNYREEWTQAKISATPTLARLLSTERDLRV